MYPRLASDGNNSTEFQISENVSTILSFFWYEFYPRGNHTYGGSRRPTVKYRKFWPRESDFSEEFKVPRLNVALSRVCILRSENSLAKFKTFCLASVWMLLKDFLS